MGRIFVAFHGFQLLVDLRALDERVENVEDGVAAPGVLVFFEEVGVVGGGLGARDAIAVPAEGFELVDEFIDDIPGPVVLLGLSAGIL